MRTRDRLRFGRDDERKVTAISVFDRGSAVRRASVARRADRQALGARRRPDRRRDRRAARPTSPTRHHFAPPTLETVVVPPPTADKGALHVALAQLAEQDPLINLRQDDVRQEIFVSLYGEVQKEVIQATLANDFGIDVEFRETTTICIERPVGTGAAVEIIGTAPNPFLATVGLRVEPAPIGIRRRVPAGGRARLDAALVLHKAVEETVQETLQPGHLRLAGHRLHGHDDALRLLGAAEQRARHLRQEHVEHGRRLPQPDAAGADERAASRPGTHGVRADAPLPSRDPGRHARTDAAGAGAAARRSADADDCAVASCMLEGEIPAARVHELQQQLPALTRGEGVLECAFDHYQPVRGTIPTRPRTDHNPLNRKEYLLHVVRRVYPVTPT